MRPPLPAALLLLLLGLAPALAPARAAEPPQHCPAIRVPPIVLPHMKATLRQNREVMVVALGSSSTEGVHATDIAHSYPALLQAQLNAALPAAHIAVLNRGIGGQDVVEMLPRIERDALGVRPTLVIWQVGANGAMKHMPADLFKRLVTNGIQRMQDAHVEVILMNNQRSTAPPSSPRRTASRSTRPWPTSRAPPAPPCSTAAPSWTNGAPPATPIGSSCPKTACTTMTTATAASPKPWRRRCWTAWAIPRPAGPWPTAARNSPPLPHAETAGQPSATPARRKPAA